MHQDPMTPPPVALALREYRALLAEHGITWGEPPVSYVRSMPFLRFPEEARRMAVPDDPDGLDASDDPGVLGEAFRLALGGRLPGGLTALRLSEDGHRLETSRPSAVLSADPVPVVLLVDSARDAGALVTVDGVPYEIGPRGAALLEATSGAAVTVDGEVVDLAGVTRAAVPARLRLRAGFPCRWTVVSADGQGWYPEGAPRRRDYHDVPFFHGDDLVLDVPAEPVTVRVTRGMEYGTAETSVIPAAWRETVVELTPERIFDAAARGWYGADLHVHLNWAGDLVAGPADAAAAQHGEDLHVLNLVAGNVSGERVYDREALQHWAGRDLPWSDAVHIARMGVEYRNDLLGHVHAFGLAAPPSIYHTGFSGTPDWPPNAAACGELRELNAVLGYAHPFHGRISSPEDVIADGRRNCAALALVVDAALGLMDGMEVLHFSELTGTVEVYRRLIGAGNRLAALAGTDTMLSFTRQDTVSNPPGWERVYARTDGPLSAESFARALRQGRTFATNGPWLELTVDGGEPGDTLDLSPGDRVTITARATGHGVERLELRTADGVLAAGQAGELVTSFVVDVPTYVVAVATGGGHPLAADGQTFAHTSPVYLDVAGRHVARPEDVRWCMRWLDLLEDLVSGHARLADAAQLADHLDLVEKARTVYAERLAISG
ncbi:CehA/McbA family metallohydrolase [Planotetraspora kaengkrachanensis]|uniref:CehA/McbA family metallohydrolase n=1 Tax=Planotetraspora kaengkrachanensis TaxID=575193 RepID=A0A8J3VAJ0_9ACTN|nr:CehA/McbA family metallohydrolase [Planotetraspora kaengkrachanensis]GIG84010.1 hypothetical protein Pka01_71370 [Planotetraspora kaengkrachanensis]